jgi:hypothetical protein
VSAVLVIAQRDRIFLVASDGVRPVLFRGVEGGPGPSRPGADPRPERLPVGLVEALERTSTPIAAAPPALREAIGRRLGRPIGAPELSVLRRIRADLPPAELPEERGYLLALARAEVERTLRSPGEVLLTLAREEERLERAVGREQRASEALLTVGESTITAYARRWAEARAALERHHAALVADLESAARSLLPNLSALVGARVAARLAAAAGGLEAAARLRAPRLQLLGSRRRPSAERGPRYGILYRADRMDEVPAPRRGAYARSLSALAAIALRADTTTRADLTRLLVGRRDRRVAALTGRRR